MTMPMTTDFYGSWTAVQKEKFAQIKRRLQPEMLEKIKKGTVLDVGCGNGLLQKEFDGHFVGVDVDEKMLAKSVSIFPCVIGDGSSLPFADYSFDAVISVDAMHLIKGRDFARVLKPGGIVLMAIFFNDSNYEERKQMLMDKLKGMKIIDEFTVNTKEKEYVVVAEKSGFE